MKRKILLGMVIAIFALSSCTKVVVPYATTVVKTSELTIGMSKKKVPEVLAVYPFDIYQNYDRSCEVHHYLYKDKQRDHLIANRATNGGLTNGQAKYVKQKDLYLIFREGKLESMITGSGIADGYNLMYFNGLSKRVCNNPEETYLTKETEFIEEDSDCEYCDLVKEILAKGNGNVNINIPTPSGVFDKKVTKVIK